MVNKKAYDETIGIRQETAKQKLLDALKEIPVILIACKRAEVSRATYYRWREEDDDFTIECEKALQEGIDLVNDMSESQLISLIKEKKMPAITWWSRHNNPKYGAKKTRNPRLPEEKLSPEDEEIMKKALALFSNIRTEQHESSA